MPSPTIESRTDAAWHARIQKPARRGPPRARSHAGCHMPLQRDRRSVEKRPISADAATLEERSRIARELHDSVAQTLYAITLAASRALTLLGRGDTDPLQRIVGEMMQLAHSGQAELRALLSDLRSDELCERGLIEALTSLAAATQTTHGTQVQLALGLEPYVSSKVKEALVRIAQEALHNVAKHANAGRVDLVLEVDSADLVLVIADDGRGFDSTLPYYGHFGLRTMRERAEAVGGTLDLGSADGRGTQIRVRAPQLVG